MEFEDGCLGGFLSMAELERYFIHGRYHHLLYFFRFPPSFTVTYLINCTTINSKNIICWSDMGNHCCLRKSSAIFDNGTNKAISRYNVGVVLMTLRIIYILHSKKKYGWKMSTDLYLSNSFSWLLLTNLLHFLRFIFPNFVKHFVIIAYGLYFKGHFKASSENHLSYQWVVDLLCSGYI